jgi:hypothetical protein
MRQMRYVEKINGRDHFEDLGAEWTITLIWILRYCCRFWTGLIWLRLGTEDGGFL